MTVVATATNHPTKSPFVWVTNMTSEPPTHIVLFLDYGDDFQWTYSRCRIFGPDGFYVQAACAAYGPKEVIHFEVDNVVSVLIYMRKLTLHWKVRLLSRLSAKFNLFSPLFSRCFKMTTTRSD